MTEHLLFVLYGITMLCLREASGLHLVNKGFERRPALILKNEQGVYDKVAVYRNKKDVEPKGTITIESKVKNSYDNLVMVFINSKGKLVNSTNKIKNDLISLNITKEGYLAYGESEHEFDKSTNQNY